MLARRKIWLNGKLVPFNQALVHIMSHSFCRGSAVFEVMSMHDTKAGPAVFRLDDHVSRLQKSAEFIHMKLPLSGPALVKAVKDAVRANTVRDGMLKLMCYYGGIEFEVVARKPVVSVAVVVVDPQKDLDAERFKKSSRKPASATVSEWRKVDPRTVPVECKCAANYLGGMVAKLEAMAAGFTTPVLCDLDGWVAEGATESIFMVKNRTLITPPLSTILSGITRRSVLEIARDINIDVKEKKIIPAELRAADEIFFTSSIVKTWPVERIENRRLDAPGEITRLITASFEKICAGNVKSYQKWLTVVK